MSLAEPSPARRGIQAGDFPEFSEMRSAVQSQEAVFQTVQLICGKVCCEVRRMLKSCRKKWLVMLMGGEFVAEFGGYPSGSKSLV